MTPDNPVSMDDEAVDELLGTGGTAVLALSTSSEDPPHSVPVSYGYDAEERTFYFRLAVGSTGSKADLDGRPVTVVVHREVEGRWRSVVAAGRLEDADADALGTETLAGMERIELPLVDIFESPTRIVDFEFYRLVPESLSGRVERSVQG